MVARAIFAKVFAIRILTDIPIPHLSYYMSFY